MLDLRSIAKALGGEVSGGQVLAPGPGHSPKDRSLSVKLAPGSVDGFVVFSHAGDDPLRCKDHVRARLGHEPFKANGGNGAKANGTKSAIERIYSYNDEAGVLLFQVLRYSPKAFRQRRADGAWNLDGVRRVPYRLPELLKAASEAKPIFVVEGEKAADALAVLGVAATCSPGGAGKWRDEYALHFAGAGDVIILPDNDDVGEKHAADIKRSIPVARVLRLPGLPDKGDAVDWIAAGGTAAKLREMLATPEAPAADRKIQLPAVIPKIQLIPFNQLRLGDGVNEWLVKKLLLSTGIGLIWGPSQTYRSFWLFDLAMYVALGWTYRGKRVRQGSVVYCAFEGGIGLIKRKEAFRKYHKLGDSEVPFYLQSIRLALVSQAKDLIEAIHAQRIKPALIVLDTLNRSMTGSESNDGDMGAYLAAADALREEFSCFVAIVHHCGWDASHSRGHTSLPFGVDVEIAVTRPADLHSTATIKKMKDDETGAAITSKLEVVEVGTDEDGDRITSLVVLECEAPIKDIKVKLKPNEQTMFSILHTAKRLSTQEWNEKARDAGIGEKRKADLYDIRMRLKDRGLITQLGDQWSVKHESE